MCRIDWKVRSELGRAALLEVKGDESPNQGRMGGRDIVKGRRAGPQDILWDLSQSGRVCVLSLGPHGPLLYAVIGLCGGSLKNSPMECVPGHIHALLQ